MSYPVNNSPFLSPGANSAYPDMLSPGGLERTWLTNYDTYNIDALTDLAYPGLRQFGEWSQQMVSTMYQNWYNSEPEKMKRMLEAGINPFVAASGIAGAGNQGVAPAPNSATNKLPEAVNAIGGAVGSLASSFGSVSNGVTQLSKLKHEIGKIDAETLNTFEQLGFTKLQSQAMAIQLKYLDEKEQIGVWQALASFDKTKAEYQNLVATHSNILAQYDEIIAHKDLLIAEKGEVDARKELDNALKAYNEEIAAFIKKEREFFEAHGYKLGTPLYEGLRDMMVSNGTFDMETFGNTVATYQGKVTEKIESVKAAASWDYRPSSVVEATAYIGQHVGESLRDIFLNANGANSWAELRNTVYSNKQAKKEFTDAYREAKDELYENYLAKRRYYRHIKRGGNNMEVARALNAMNNAKQEYDSFTEDAFGNQLLSEFTKNVLGVE